MAEKYRIYGITATRRGLTEFQRDYAARILGSSAVEVHHGDCVGGDAEVHDIVSSLNGRRDGSSIKIVLHPPASERMRAFRKSFVVRIHPPRPYLQRNHDIVDACDVLLAFPGERREQVRSGTWSTVRYARSVGKKPVIIIYPEGDITSYLKKSEKSGAGPEQSQAEEEPLSHHDQHPERLP